MKLFVLTLLIAGSIATHRDSEKFDRQQGHRVVRSPQGATCVGENCGKIFVADTWAGQCFGNTPGCRDLFCLSGEVIDRSTCKPDGRLEDCKCISTSTIAPSTIQPTRDPFAGCESCRNSELSVSDTFAGHCFPQRSNGRCSCLCADVFCSNGEMIDRTTCVDGGSITGCRCIGAIVSTTTSSSE